MPENVTPERLARLKKLVPKGKIQIIPLPPFGGENLEPVSTRDLGLGERKAA